MTTTGVDVLEVPPSCLYCGAVGDNHAPTCQLRRAMRRRRGWLWVLALVSFAVAVLSASWWTGVIGSWGVAGGF